MPSRRVHASKVTKSYEDAGLFKSDLVSVETQVHPIMRTSSRGDVQMAASFGDGQTVHVIFPGRRARDVRALAKHVTQCWTQEVEHASKQGAARPDPYDVATPIALTGCWRPIFSRDESGCETRHYQFLAATWTYQEPKGERRSFGSPPCF